MKYCDDTNCTNLHGCDCELGFVIRFRPPKSYSDIQNRNWGYVMPKPCRNKFYPTKKAVGLSNGK